MHKRVAVLLSLVMLAAIAGCGKRPAVSEAAANPPATELERLTIAQAGEVYARPDDYIGKTYEGLFLIYSEPMALEDEGCYVCTAGGLVRGAENAGNTILKFDAPPELAANETIFVEGIIEGKGAIMDGQGGSIDVLWLNVTAWEKDAAAADGRFSGQAKWDAPKASGPIRSGPLSIEVISLDFQQDGTTLMTKTQDEAAAAKTTYYMDIILHQNGCFAWYPNCNFWIVPGIPGYDTVPFPPLDASEPITIQFYAFDETGASLYGLMETALAPPASDG